jgi:hypothetical protein
LVIYTLEELCLFRVSHQIDHAFKPFIAVGRVAQVVDTCLASIRPNVQNSSTAKHRKKVFDEFYMGGGSVLVRQRGKGQKILRG